MHLLTTKRLNFKRRRAYFVLDMVTFDELLIEQESKGDIVLKESQEKRLN
jgi:hypothetical protein